MYLDLFDELRLNKRLVRLAGFEVAAYWAELTSILKQVVKKHTADEQGFFILDRDFVEHETTLTINKQLKCDEILTRAGVMLKDEENPNRISIGVHAMIEYITDEDITKLTKKVVKSKQTETKEAKIAAMKTIMKNTICEPDLALRKAYDLWVDALIDATYSGTSKYNCTLTKAAVELFQRDMNTVTNETDRLKAIEIATINLYKNAEWAIQKLRSPARGTSVATNLPEQKICTAVSNDVF
jgi:hypothetical protein